jgi:hypothetical protein
VAKVSKQTNARSSRQLREALARAERAEAEVARLKAEIKEIKFEFYHEQRALEEVEEYKRAPGRRREVPHAVIAALENKFSFDEIMNKEPADLVAAIKDDLPVSKKTVERHVAKARLELSMRRFIQNSRAQSKTS